MRTARRKYIAVRALFEKEVMFYEIYSIVCGDQRHINIAWITIDRISIYGDWFRQTVASLADVWIQHVLSRNCSLLSFAFDQAVLIMNNTHYNHNLTSKLSYTAACVGTYNINLKAEQDIKYWSLETSKWMSQNILIDTAGHIKYKNKALVVGFTIKFSWHS